MHSMSNNTNNGGGDLDVRLLGQLHHQNDIAIRHADKDEEEVCSEHSSLDSDHLWTPVLPPHLVEIIQQLNDNDKQDLYVFYSLLVMVASLMKSSSSAASKSGDLSHQVFQAFQQQSFDDGVDPIGLAERILMNVSTAARQMPRAVASPREKSVLPRDACISSPIKEERGDIDQEKERKCSVSVSRVPNQGSVDVGHEAFQDDLLQYLLGTLNKSRSGTLAPDVETQNDDNAFDKPQLDFLTQLANGLLKFEQISSAGDTQPAVAAASGDGPSESCYFETPRQLGDKLVIREQLSYSRKQSARISDLSTEVPCSFNTQSSPFDVSLLSSKLAKVCHSPHQDTPGKSHTELTQTSSVRSSTDSSWSPSETPDSLEVLRECNELVDVGPLPPVRMSEPRPKGIGKRRVAPNFSQLCMSCGKPIQSLDLVQCCLCQRRFCALCARVSQQKQFQGSSMPFNHAKKCCAVCAFQRRHRPNASVDEWHCKFHTSEDLRFVHELRDALPYLSGLFIEIHFSRPPCWRRKFGTRRGNFSFKFYGGIFEARLEALLRSQIDVQTTASR